MRKLHLVLATIGMFLVADGLIMQEAYARRGGSFRSSSSRSWGSRSSSKSSSSWGSRKKSSSTTKSRTKSATTKKKLSPGFGGRKSTSAKKQTSKKKFTKKTPFQKKMSKKVSKKQAKASLTKYKANKTKFKKGSSSSSVDYSKSRSFNSIRSSGNYDSRTYYTRRDSFYGGYHSPYMYNSYSSFGMWDAMMMWYILDHINESRYRNMYYHHMNDPGFQQFRSEANRLSAENEQLKAKLNNLDSEVNKLKTSDIKQDPTYVPEGVDADLLLSEEAVNRLQPTLNLCTGPKNGNYHFAGEALANQSGLNINVTSTDGSSQNLTKLTKGECDAAFVQHDSLTSSLASTLEVATVMYPEFGHLICNKSTKIKNIRDLKSGHTVAVGTQGSGSRLTWKNLKTKYSNLEGLSFSSTGGSQAVVKLLSSQVDCMFTVISLNSKLFDVIEKEETLFMAEIDNSDLTSIKDSSGTVHGRTSVYEIVTIPKGVYPNLQGKKWFIFRRSTTTVTTRAVLVVSKKWIEKNKEGYDTLNETLLSVKNKIDDHVDPEN